MGVSVKYKGGVIAEMEESGTKTLKTSGMYCEDDITIEHTGSAAEETEPTFMQWDITVSSGRPASGSIMTLLTDEWLAANRTNAGLRVAVTPKFTITDTANKQFQLYNGNTPIYTLNGTSYYSFARLIVSSAVTMRQRSIPLSSAVNDVGDMDITSEGALRVVASSSAPMAVGDYTVTAWIDN